MSKSVKSDKRVQRTMLALFRDIATHGQENAEAAITAENCRQTDKKTLVAIRDLYTDFAGASAKPEVLESIDYYINIRTRQSPTANKPTEDEIVALYKPVLVPFEAPASVVAEQAALPKHKLAPAKTEEEEQAEFQATLDAAFPTGDDEEVVNE